MIRKGDTIRIRPEFQDDGDDQFRWIAVEDSHDERGKMPRLKITPTDTGLAIAPVYVVTPDQIFEQF